MLPNERRHRALVSDAYRKGVRGMIGQNAGTVPQHEADAETETLAHMRKQKLQIIKTLL